LAVAVLLLLGLGACGEADDDGSGSTAKTASAPKSEEGEIRIALESLRETFDKGQGVRFCNLLTEAGRERVATRAFPGQGFSCRQAIEKFAEFDRLANLKNEPAKTVSVAIDGDVAVATVKDGPRKPYKMKVVREEGEWLIPDAGLDFEY
jgi:hypothetical protein